MIEIEQDIALELTSRNIVTNATYGNIPSPPGNVVVIASYSSLLRSFESSTFTSQNAMAQKLVCLPNVPDTRETLSILSINDTYAAAHDSIWAVYNFLMVQNNGSTTCNGRQMFFVPIQPPYFYKTDSGKTYFIFNVNVNTTRES